MLPPLFGWQEMGEERALSLSNMRRLGGGLLLYAQDWDYRFAPQVSGNGRGLSRTWPEAIRPYVGSDVAFSNPSNPVKPFQSLVRDPLDNCSVDTSYALNRRFNGTFAPGPFPIENLELPDQTALLVEAGPMREAPKSNGKSKTQRDIALIGYSDTTFRVANLVPYPSTHDGKMAIVAVDGHGAVVSVAHYNDKSGAHDSQYGRIGAGIYNWNGGHPNGETDRPVRE